TRCTPPSPGCSTPSGRSAVSCTSGASPSSTSDGPTSSIAAVTALVRGPTRADLTGLLLVGGASSRFGSPKALARLDGETLAERGWRTLGKACAHRLAVGKRDDELSLPFAILDDGSDVRAPIVGLVAGLRAAPTDLCVALPVDCPLVTVEMLLELAAA